jgi:hypothetical protein
MLQEDSPLIEAIELWGDLTGTKVPTDETDYDWRDRGSYRALKEALELDPTEITATLLFKVLIREWMGSASTNMQDLLDNPEKIAQQLATAKKLLAIVDREEIVQARDQFIAGLTQGLEAYGAAEREDIQKLLGEPDTIAILRRDALRSLANLRVDQFLDGEPEPEDVRPVYVNSIRQFWNINSLLAAMTGTPSGVCVALIRDPFIYDTFFAFSIRNGGRLFVLTDKGVHAHPLASKMSRRPDKDLDRRMSKNWFPYELLNVDYNEEGKLIFTASAEKGVTPYNEDGIPTKKIGEVGPHETIWLTMMLDLIVHKFWRGGFRAKELSYTGEMIHDETKLLERAQIAGLPVVSDGKAKLNLPALKIEDINNPLVDADAFGRARDRRHAWMEERYGPRVNLDAINTIGVPKITQVLDRKTGEVRALTQADEAGMNRRSWMSEKPKSAEVVVLQSMSSVDFGTREQLDRDRKFLARHSYAKQIDEMARDEFRERSAEVRAFFNEKVKTNKDAILALAARTEDQWLYLGRGESFEEPSVEDTGGAVRSRVVKGEEKEWRPGTDVWRTFMRVFDLEEIAREMRGSDSFFALGRSMASHAGLTLGAWEQRRGMLCAVTGQKASYSRVFYPNTCEDIAWLCGCTVDELPDVLQHYSLRDDGSGNSILTRIDPMLWATDNPWKAMDLRVNVPLSKRGLAQLQKLPPANDPPHLSLLTEDQLGEDTMGSMKIKFGGVRRERE